MKTWAIGIGLIVLFAAVGVQFRHGRAVQSGKGKHLSAAMEQAGDEFRALPLGPSEGTTGEVEKVLRFDDVLYREYRNATGGVRFSLYAAYWNPGEMPVQLVASHTPDRCWTEAGWTCLEHHADEGLAIGAVRLHTAQARVFKDPMERTEHVLFWHLVGAELYDYGDRFNEVPSAWRWGREVARQVVRSPSEQYFIRLSSDRPLDELAGDPTFRAVLKCLADLGLAESEARKSER